jgi:UPF0755 protein
MNEDATDQLPVKKRHRKKKVKWKNVIILIILLIIINFAIFGGLHVYRSLQPMQNTSETVSFTVGDQETTKQICTDLYNDGLIEDVDVAYYYAKLNKLTDFIAGNFELDKSWSLEKLLTTLNDHAAMRSDYNRVTIVEGDWAKDAAIKLAGASNVSADELLALWSNRTWIESEMAKYPFLTEEMFNSNVRIYLEGYLAPETYFLPASDTTAEKITEMILDQTLTVYNKYSSLISQSSLSIHQIFTLASIVQYEGGGDMDTLKNIASVFYNRLNLGMPLQSSVTVCYAIDFDKLVDNWQACEVNGEYDSAYNTYKNAGLPPGAVENAGTSALEAVLSPNQTDYLYFMAEVSTGKVYFASTYEEHLKNIEDHPN